MLTYFSWIFFSFVFAAYGCIQSCRLGSVQSQLWHTLAGVAGAVGVCSRRGRRCPVSPVSGKAAPGFRELLTFWFLGLLQKFFLLSSDLFFHVFILIALRIHWLIHRDWCRKRPPKVRPRDIYWTAAAKWHRLSSGSKQDVVHEWHKIWPNCQRIPAALADVRPIRFFTRGATGRRIGRAESGQGCVVWPELGLQMCVLKLSSHKNKIWVCLKMGYP